MTGFYGRWVLPAAGVLLALATVAGALGAHLLAGRWSASRLGIYDIAVRYQFDQSLGLLAMGVLLRGLHPENLTSAKRQAVQRFMSAPRLLLTGILLFCGSLYALSLGATSRWVELATPCRGAMLIGWLVTLRPSIVWRSELMNNERSERRADSGLPIDEALPQLRRALREHSSRC